MNTGLIASRYAKALLRFVDETGNGETVCRQAKLIEDALKETPALAAVLRDPALASDAKKMALLQSAVGELPMAEELKRFIRLVFRNGRMPFLSLIFHTFVDMYYREKGKRFATLTAVMEPSEELIHQVLTLVKKKTGYDIILETRVDPSLIGGFVFDIDDYIIDGSVAHQLDVIRRQFVEKNRRIV